MGPESLVAQGVEGSDERMAFAAFGGSLAEALIPFECAFGNTECLSRKSMTLVNNKLNYTENNV